MLVATNQWRMEEISRKRGGHLTCNQLSGRFRLKFEGGGRKSTVSPVATAILRSTHRQRTVCADWEMGQLNIVARIASWLRTGSLSLHFEKKE